MRRSLHALMVMMGLCMMLSCQTHPLEGFLPQTSSDAAITNSVQMALTNHDMLSPFRFHVETSNGVVYLSGYVKTIRQSDTAELVASQVPGVHSVENNIIVRK